MNKKKEALLYAYEKGYRVNLVGEVISPRGITRVLKPSSSKNFRLCFSVKNKRLGISDNVSVHRLQAYQKFGNQIFLDGIEVRHLDSNFLNNSYENMGIGNHSENMMDMPLNDRIRKSHLACKKITKHDGIAFDVRAERASGKTYKEIGLIFNISKSTINHILHHSVTY